MRRIRFYLAVLAHRGNKSGADLCDQSKNKGSRKNRMTRSVTGSSGRRALFSTWLGVGSQQNLLLGCSGDGATGTQMITIIMKATTAR